MLEQITELLVGETLPIRWRDERDAPLAPRAMQEHYWQPRRVDPARALRLAARAAAEFAPPLPPFAVDDDARHSPSLWSPRAGWWCGRRGANNVARTIRRR